MLSKAQILDHVWHYDFGGDGNVVETYVSYLRKKLEVAGPPVIHTVRLVGYALREPAAGLSVSLRARLLVAVGVIAIVALAIADVVTYSALQSFLYQRVDQQLAGQSTGSTSRPSTRACTVPCAGGPTSRSPGAARRPAAGAATRTATAPPTPSRAVAVQVAHDSRARSWAARTARSTSTARPTRRPSPRPITGFSNGRRRHPGGLLRRPVHPGRGARTFRVRASTVSNGDVLVLAQPLGDTESTLHQLLVIELLVTAGAVVIALAAGFWLVRLGPAPAAGHGDGGRVDRRGQPRPSGSPARTTRPRSAAWPARSTSCSSRIESAFGARVASEAAPARVRRRASAGSWATPPTSCARPIAAISRLRRAVRAGGLRTEGGPRAPHGRHPHRDRADGAPRRRPAARWPASTRAARWSPHPVDLVALCAEAVQTARTVGPAWPVPFRAARPIEVTGDATGLRQVIDNLLGQRPGPHPRGDLAPRSPSRPTAPAP